MSCITDRDIPPKAAGVYTSEVKRRSGIVEQVYLLKDGGKTEEDYSEAEIVKKIDAKKISIKVVMLMFLWATRGRSSTMSLS